MADSPQGPTSQQPTADGDRSVFEKSFSESTRRELIEEDRVAWRNVCGVLFSIVAMGLVLGITGVLLATWN